MVTLTLFPTRSPLGLELARQIKILAQEKFGFNVTVLDKATSWQFFQACANSDAVVLDATIEENSADHNYGYATPLKVENLLVVARSYIPLNYGGVIEGGTANYLDEMSAEGQKSNKSIIEWLDKELQKIKDKSNNKSFFQELMPSFLKIAINQFQSSRTTRQFLKERNFIFVSYRSACFNQLRDYIYELKQSKEFQDTEILYFAPGELVYEDEILSPLRRWMLLSLIQDYILAAKEIWLFWNQDYINSWWTRGEIFSTMYFTDENTISEKLKILEPVSKKLYPVKTTHLPELSEVHKKRMARNQANSHPDMMAPETLDRNKLIRETLPNVSIVQKLFMLEDPVFSAEFWEYYVIPHSEKSDRHISEKDSLSPERFFDKLRNLDADDFLKLFHNGDYIATQSQMEQAAKVEFLIFPNESDTVKIIEEKPRFLWVPQPQSSGENSQWGRLEKLPVYRKIE